MSTKWVYRFGGKQTDGSADMKNLLGGKGANLAEMSSIDLPVPPGFTICTDVCTYYYDNEKTYPADLETQVKDGLKAMEENLGMVFGDETNPLLVSVRSGARVSMPGMMDTVLNLGLNDQTVSGLATKSGDERFAWDSYRRFIQMYGDVVLGVDHHDFETALEDLKRDEDVLLDKDLNADALKELVETYKGLVKEYTGKDFPDCPHEQLWGAISAVFGSWDIPRARAYRSIHDIPAAWGTAVNIQAMVFGNMGDDCATGVAFTRDPSTGDNYFYGEFLINAQGEDVVAGIRTPNPLSKFAKEKEGSDLPSMEDAMPEIYKELDDIRHKLEHHYGDVQDIEFTVQQGHLYMLQTRTGKRTAKAAIKIAVDMVNDGTIDKQTALLRVDPMALDQLLHPTLDPMAHKNVLTKGLPASPGAARGTVVFNADEAEKRAERGEAIILCRRETSPEDIHGMHAAKGILTSRGGMTSHAAVVARGMGRPCVAGAGELHIDEAAKTMTVLDNVIVEGDVLTLDGTTGEVILGAVETIDPVLTDDFRVLMEWADDIARMDVRTNAETVLDAKTAVEFGAVGIGLCRTEHMFFDPERIQNVREMIFSRTVKDREAALSKLLPVQRQDFKDLFVVMEDLPVTIRLLDPPLHEFLPHTKDDLEKFAKTAGIDLTDIQQRHDALQETNPMLGHRGCRLGITYPEIYKMQAQAIFEGAIAAYEKTGKSVSPEIMIPLVAVPEELSVLRKVVEEAGAEVFEKAGKSIDYTVGTMIELPRAALVADQIAEHADFFSFGTNDLTQTTLGISRDDAGRFMPEYINKGVLPYDPFSRVDPDGVGALVKIGRDKGVQVKPDLKVGVCGEHGGEPHSIAFFDSVGLDYVSCSPYRVPIARLAAAQATIEASQTNSNGGQIQAKKVA
jgi:pyruvate,orthophosphate dikinase